MKPFSVVLLLFASTAVLTIGQEGSLKPIAEMSEEEAFSQLLSYSGRSEPRSLDGSLETEGWEIINSLIAEGPSEEFANRLDKMIRIVGLHPSSTRYSVDQARILLLNVTPRIQELLDDERISDYAEFRAADPFGGTGSRDAPEGYDDFFSAMKYLDDIAGAAMNVIAVKGGDSDIEVLEQFAVVDADPFPVSFSSMAKESKRILKSKLEEQTESPSERSIAGSGSEAEIEPPATGGNSPMTSETEAIEHGSHAGVQGKSEQSRGSPNWALAVIVIAVLGILFLLVRAFLRGRAS